MQGTERERRALTCCCVCNDARCCTVPYAGKGGEGEKSGVGRERGRRESSGSRCFFGENVMRVSHSSCHAAVKERCVLKSIYMRSSGEGGEADSSLLPWQHSTIGAATNTLGHDGRIWWRLPVRMACSGGLTDARSSPEPWVRRSPGDFHLWKCPPPPRLFLLYNIINMFPVQPWLLCITLFSYTKTVIMCTRQEETKSHLLISSLSLTNWLGFVFHLQKPHVSNLQSRAIQMTTITIRGTPPVQATQAVMYNDLWTKRHHRNMYKYLVYWTRER